MGPSKTLPGFSDNFELPILDVTTHALLRRRFQPVMGETSSTSPAQTMIRPVLLATDAHAVAITESVSALLTPLALGVPTVGFSITPNTY